VTDWFKQNPFVGGITALTAVLALAGLYFAYSHSASLTEQTDLFATNTSAASQLQSAKPFPNKENIEAAESELKQATKVLEDLATEVSKQTVAADPALTPRAFQDKLSAAAASAESLAAATGVSIPEDFYLGFTEYKAEPPSQEAAPMLGQQLETIASVTGILLKSGVKQLVAIERVPLATEKPSETDEDKGAESDPTTVQLAPFDVEFVADPASFRSALSAIITSRPIVMVRLVSVSNSNPAPPAKESTATSQEPIEPGSTGEKTTEIPVVFGKENLTVKLRLASVSLPAPVAKK